MDDPELVEGHGGWFELDEAATKEGGRAGELMTQAHEAFSIDDDDTAEDLCRQVLAANSDHTEALYLIARLAARRGDFDGAIATGLHILSIEPNIRPYRFTLMEWAAEAGQLNMFLSLLEEMETKWPGEHRINDLAARVLLAVGKPDDAIRLKIPRSVETDNLIRQIALENSAKVAGREEMAKARSKLMKDRDEEVMRHLQRAYRHYPKDLYVVANLGFTLLRNGDWNAAYDLIGGVVTVMPPDLRDTCLANMAFALALGKDYPRAADLLNLVAERHLMPDGTIAFRDLPGRAVWVKDGPELELLMERPEAVAPFVRQIVDNATARARGSVPHSLKALLAAYDRGPDPGHAGNPG